MKLNVVKGAVATKEEFTRFFLKKINHELLLAKYSRITGKSIDNKPVVDMNEIFGDMFDKLDQEWKPDGEEGQRWTFRRYLLLVLEDIKEKTSDNELAYVDSLRSP